MNDPSILSAGGLAARRRRGSSVSVRSALAAAEQRRSTGGLVECGGEADENEEELYRVFVSEFTAAGYVDEVGEAAADESAATLVAAYDAEHDELLRLASVLDAAIARVQSGVSASEASFQREFDRLSRGCGETVAAFATLDDRFEVVAERAMRIGGRLEELDVHRQRANDAAKLLDLVMALDRVSPDDPQRMARIQGLLVSDSLHEEAVLVHRLSAVVVDTGGGELARAREAIEAREVQLMGQLVTRLRTAYGADDPDIAGMKAVVETMLRVGEERRCLTTLIDTFFDTKSDLVSFNRLLRRDPHTALGSMKQWFLEVCEDERAIFAAVFSASKRAHVMHKFVRQVLTRRVLPFLESMLSPAYIRARAEHQLAEAGVVLAAADHGGVAATAAGAADDGPGVPAYAERLLYLQTLCLAYEHSYGLLSALEGFQMETLVDVDPEEDVETFFAPYRRGYMERECESVAGIVGLMVEHALRAHGIIQERKGFFQRHLGGLLNTEAVGHEDAAGAPGLQGAAANELRARMLGMASLVRASVSATSHLPPTPQAAEAGEGSRGGEHGETGGGDGDGDSDGDVDDPLVGPAMPGEPKVSIHLASRILAVFQDAMKRCRRMAFPFELGESLQRLFALLLSNLCGSYLGRVATHVAEAMPTVRGGQALLRDPPPLGQLLATVERTHDVVALLQGHYQHYVLPYLGGEANVVAACEAGQRSHLAHIEDAINDALERAVAAIAAHARALLAAHQKPADFAPTSGGGGQNPGGQGSSLAALAATTHGVYGTTDAAHVLVAYMDRVQGQVRAHQGEDNAALMLGEIGLAIVNVLLGHIRGFTYNDAGAMRLLADVQRYQVALATFGVAAVDQAFGLVREICNLFLVQPQNIQAVVEEGQLGMLDAKVVQGYVSRRADYGRKDVRARIEGR